MSTVIDIGVVEESASVSGVTERWRFERGT